MVMSLEYHVDAQLLEDGAQSVPELYNVAFGYMACHRIHGLMEANHVPVGIGVLFQCLLQECLVVCNGQVGGVEHHKLYATIGKAVVAVPFPVLTIGGDTRHLEVLGIQGGVIAVIVVAHQSCQGNGAEVLIVEKAAVLRLHLVEVGAVRCIVLVDLVAQREQEAVVRAVGKDLIYGLGPALNICIQIVGIQLRVANCRKAEAFGSKCRRLIAVLLGGLAAHGNSIGVLGGGLQTAEVHMVDVIPVLGSLLYLCGIILPAKMQHCRIGIGIVPGDTQAVLGCTDVHSQAVHCQFIALRLCGCCQLLYRQINIRAGSASLMELYCQHIGAIHQHRCVGHRNLTGLGGTGIGAAIGQVGSIAAGRLIKGGYLFAVDIDNGSIIIVERSQELCYGTGILHLEGGAEEKCGNVIAGNTANILAQQHGGRKIHIRIAGAQVRNAAVLCAKGTCRCFPAAVVIVCLGPAQPVIALCRCISGWIGVIVQIPPSGGQIHGFCLRSHGHCLHAGLEFHVRSRNRTCQHGNAGCYRQNRC